MNASDTVPADVSTDGQADATEADALDDGQDADADSFEDAPTETQDTDSTEPDGDAATDADPDAGDDGSGPVDADAQSGDVDTAQDHRGRRTCGALAHAAQPRLPTTRRHQVATDVTPTPRWGPRERLEGRGAAAHGRV